MILDTISWCLLEVVVTHKMGTGDAAVPAQSALEITIFIYLNDGSALLSLSWISTPLCWLLHKYPTRTCFLPQKFLSEAKIITNRCELSPLLLKTIPPFTALSPHTHLLGPLWTYKHSIFEKYSKRAQYLNNNFCADS